VKEACARFTAALAAALVFVASSGCSNSTTIPLSAEAKAAVEKEASPSAVGPEQIDGPMPASLDEAYQEAEKVFNAVSSLKASSSPILLTDLKSSLKKVRADLNPVTNVNDARGAAVKNKEDLLDSGVASLEDAMRAHDRESARRESQEITLPIAKLAGMYASPVSGELMMLKYYSRQFDIFASTDNAPALKETADNVRQIWNGLRPAVEAHGGVAEAGRFNDLVNDLEKNGRPGQIGGLLQDRIDEIQAVLKR
jgi:hypothetical protein